MSILLLLAFVLPLLVGTIAGSEVPTDLTGFPTCAQTCISNNHGKCALLDMDCMCNNQVPTIFSCMQGSCNAEDQAATLKFAQDLCDQVNATSTAKISAAAKTGATTLATAVTTITGSPEVTPPSPSAGSSSPRLSTAATAGVGVGAALGAVALAAGGFFFWRRKRSQGMKELPDTVVREVEHDYTLPPAYGQKGMVHHEADGVQWMELEAKEATQYIR